MGYTKGEWKAEFRFGSWRVEYGDVGVICDMWGDNKKISKANAQLVASTPDLYEALKLATGRLHILEYQGRDSTGLLNRCVLALAKAEGK